MGLNTIAGIAKQQAARTVTVLPPDQETQFRTWISQNKVRFDPADPNQDYDMRGFWKAYSNPKDPEHRFAVTRVDPYDKELHYTDYWKRPNHPTFSTDSKYAKNVPNAPHWEKDRFLVTPDGRTIFDAAGEK